MNSESRFIQAAVWGFLGVVIVSVVGVYVSTVLSYRTPPLPVYGEVPDFKLTNQLGSAVVLADLKGSIWVADIIFTRCPGPCLEMTRKLKAIQSSLPAQLPVKFVSLTADPGFDTPDVLNQYGARFKADPNNWLFLTGPKQAVYDFAMKGLKLAVEENPKETSGENLFIHSTRFVLVDRTGRLRGLSFEGTEAGTVSAVVRAVGELVKEK